MIVSDKIQSRLSKIKKNITESYNFSQPSNKCFNIFKKFLYDSTLDGNDIALLETLKKPQIEFNVLTAHLLRLEGEFAAQVPGLEVGAENQENVTHEEVKLIETMEGHIRHVLFAPENFGRDVEIFSDELSGGFGVGEVLTKYKDDESFEQIIDYKRSPDPTLVGFDPMADKKDKSDGSFCYKLFPMKEKEFERKYNITIKEFSTAANFGEFTWSYIGKKEKIVLVVEYFEKKMIKKKLVQLANGKTLYKKDYEKYMEEWNNNNLLEIPAKIIRERWVDKTIICRYVLIENSILEYEETDWKYLPFVKFSGNSHRIKMTGDEIVEKTNPYVYHAKDALRMKNFAGQTLVNEIENLVQNKMIVAKEAIPDEKDYRDMYTEIQYPGNYVYNHIHKDNIQVTLPPPVPVQRPGIPNEIFAAFTSADQVIQASLGAYNAELGINGNDISGKAIRNGTLNSSASARPYLQGYLMGLNQVAQICLDLIFKYYLSPRKVPILDREGKKSYADLSIPKHMKASDFNIRVVPGANFSLQKQEVLETIGIWMKNSPAFAGFINTKCLPLIIENFEIKGVERLKELAIEYQQELEQQQKMAAQQPNPEQIKIQLAQQTMQLKQQEMQMKQQQMQIDAMLKQQDMALRNKDFQMRDKELQNAQNDTSNDTLKIMLEAKEAHEEAIVQLAKANTEREVHAHNIALEHIDMHHRHNKEINEFKHE